ncbi:hypothetical protein C8A05DRAFT_39335 [Staphylotrichum tortipilum]|uniref:Uncharacterized protein n=1 Tax=Staphylotrichum tortipilum TaxID=2831512 RepID=A0AAN6MB21_9PEZI|nr:hypothetical protein C8A05DRAFT_39335 [Staphylotrichum longicolle]
MARARFPAAYAIIQLFLRGVSVALCIATLASASYATSRAGYGTGMIGAFIAAILTLFVDLAEISGLSDPARHVRRCTENALVYLEILTMAVCGIVPIMVLLAFLGLQRHDCEVYHPKEECDEMESRRREVRLYVDLSWILPVSLVGLHLIFAVLACVDCFKRRRRRPEPYRLR